MQALRIVVAEDKDFVASRLAAQLENLGHSVVGVARDGRSAVESAWRLLPDLMFVSLPLPVLDGIEASRAILTRHAIPIVLLAGYTSAGLVRRAQEAGVLTHLVWPAETYALGDAIRVALIRFRELRILSDQAGDLQQALRARLVVERARKMVMRRLDLSEAEAFRYMRQQSLTTGLPVRELAANMLMVAEFLFGKSDIVRCVGTILDVLKGREAVGPQQVA